MPLKLNSSLTLIVIFSLLMGCNDSTHYHTTNACKSEYYTELLGDYKGSITTHLFDSEEQTELLHECTWDVELSLVPNTIGGTAICGNNIYSEVLSIQSSTSNHDGSEHQCIALNTDKFSGGVPHHDDYDFHDAPIWPVTVILAQEFDRIKENNSELDDTKLNLTPLVLEFVHYENHPTGIYAYISKRDDGNIEILPVETYPELGISGFLVKQ